MKNMNVFVIFSSNFKLLAFSGMPISGVGKMPAKPLFGHNAAHKGIQVIGQILSDLVLH